MLRELLLRLKQTPTYASHATRNIILDNCPVFTRPGFFAALQLLDVLGKVKVFHLFNKDAVVDDEEQDVRVYEQNFTALLLSMPILNTLHNTYDPEIYVPQTVLAARKFLFGLLALIAKHITNEEYTHEQAEFELALDNCSYINGFLATAQLREAFEVLGHGVFTGSQAENAPELELHIQLGAFTLQTFSVLQQVLPDQQPADAHSFIRMSFYKRGKYSGKLVHFVLFLMNNSDSGNTRQFKKHARRGAKRNERNETNYFSRKRNERKRHIEDKKQN